MRLALSLFFVCAVSFAAPAPNFQGDLLGGGRVALKDKIKKDKALLVCFWASWCEPCLAELRTVMERLKSEPNLPLEVLTVNVDTPETATDVRPTLRLHKFDFPVVMDPKHEIFGKYQQTKLLPFSVLVGPTGNIAATFNGYHESMFAKVKEALGATNAKN